MASASSDELDDSLNDGISPSPPQNESKPTGEATKDTLKTGSSPASKEDASEEKPGDEKPATSVDKGTTNEKPTSYSSDPELTLTEYPAAASGDKPDPPASRGMSSSSGSAGPASEAAKYHAEDKETDVKDGRTSSRVSFKGDSAADDLEEQLLARTEELVAARYENVKLYSELQRAREAAQASAKSEAGTTAAGPPAPAELDTLRAEMQETRSALLAALPLGQPEDGSAGSSAPRPEARLPELARLLASHASAGRSSDAESQADQLREELRASRAEGQRLHEDLQEARVALEEAQLEVDQMRADEHASGARMAASQLRSLRQRHKRLKHDLAGSEDKVDALTEHIEKLMIHLKHEAAAKARAMDAARKAEREAGRLRERGHGLAQSNLERERVILELKEGAKILEDQLRLMDQKYVELRGKLDWTRAHAKKEVARAEKQVDHVRRQWIQVQAAVPRKLRQQIADPPPPLKETLAKKGKRRKKKKAGAGAAGSSLDSSGAGSGLGMGGAGFDSSGKRSDSEAGAGPAGASPMRSTGGFSSGGMEGGRRSGMDASTRDQDYSQAMSMLDAAPGSRPQSSQRRGTGARR